MRFLSLGTFQHNWLVEFIPAADASDGGSQDILDVREGCVVSDYVAVFQVGSVYFFLLIFVEELLSHEDLIAWMRVQDFSEVQDAAADLFALAVDHFQQTFGHALWDFEVQHLILPNRWPLRRFLLILGLQFLLTDGQLHTDLVIADFSPDGGTLEPKRDYSIGQLIKGSLKGGITELFILIGGQDAPELMWFSLAVDQRVGIDCPIRYEFLLIKHTYLNGPAVSLEETIDSKRERLVYLMLFLQHRDGLGGELLVGDSDLEGWSGQGGVFGEGNAKDDDFQHSDWGFCLDERGNFRLWSAAHVIRLFSAVQASHLKYIRQQEYAKSRRDGRKVRLM